MIHADERGYFKEVIREGVKQINQSFSKKFTVRGLHYQTPEVTKWVWVPSGVIYDVLFNVETGEYRAEVLSGDNHKMLEIPKGWAHGFQALEDSIVCYAMDRVYSPEGDKCISPESINWPLAKKIISEKDRGAPKWVK